MRPPQPGGYFQGGMHPPLAALQPLCRGCHGNERGRLPFASRDARRQHSSAWPWPRCRTTAEILIRANCQETTPILRAERGSCRHSVVPSPGLALHCIMPSLAVWGALVSPNLARTRASHPCGGRASPGWSPAAPKCRQTSHRTAREPIYFPHLKKVIKRKGRSYLFFCCASPELSNSQIKSWKRLMKGRGWRQGLVGSGAALGLGRCWGDASQGGRVGAPSPTALPGRGFSGCCGSERDLGLVRGQIWETQSRGSGWAPRSTAQRFKRLRCRHPRTATGLPQCRRWGCTLGLAPRGHRCCRARTGRQPCPSLVRYPRRSAIFTGEEFFLIGPHGDIRAIFKEV